MSLPWVRLDASIASHDKTLGLLADPSPKRWQAMTSYLFALGWCGEHGTDGAVPEIALPFVHGSKVTASLLVKHGFWDTTEQGWQVRNYIDRQELAVVTEAKRAAQRFGARKGNCRKYHGRDCNCWREEEAQ